MDCCQKNPQTKDLSTLSLWALADEYKDRRFSWDQQLLAEVAYALAMGHKRAAESMDPGYEDAADEYLAQARQYAKKCLDALSGLPSDTLYDVSTKYCTLAGVTLPNYFYKEDAEMRLKQEQLVS